MKHLVPAYSTPLGAAYCADARDLLDALDEESVDLIVTSPPFALLRQKTYGNEAQDAYVDWLLEFGRRAHRVLKPTGSFVLDLGGAYQRGLPVRSLHQYRVLLRFCDELGYFLAEEFFWHNPAKLPSPIEWVNKRKIRAKDTVNTVWWFAKTEWPQADVREVLTEYSDRMKKLLEDSERFYTPKLRPSGHDVARTFDKDNGGAIPPNLLSIPNTESNSRYLHSCKAVGVNGHPARFPAKLPEFFIKFLTKPGDLVLDIFAGSNTTGEVAESLGRHWIACDLDRAYVAASIFRFCESEEKAQELFAAIEAGEQVSLATDFHCAGPPHPAERTARAFCTTHGTLTVRPQQIAPHRNEDQTTPRQRCHTSQQSRLPNPRRRDPQRNDLHERSTGSDETGDPPPRLDRNAIREDLGRTGHPVS